MDERIKNKGEIFELIFILCFGYFLLYTFINFLYSILEVFIDKLILISSFIFLILILYIIFSEKLANSNNDPNHWTYFNIPLIYCFITYSKSNFIIEELIKYNDLIYNFLLIIFFLIHIYVINKFKNEIYFNNGLIKKIILIFTTLFIGSFLIYGFTQTEKFEFDLLLNECNSGEKYHKSKIKCENLMGVVLVNTKANCKLENLKNIKNISGSFNFTLLNGSNEVQYFSNKIFFNTPNNVGRVDLFIKGYENDKNICLSSGYNINFPTKEEFKQNKKDFITYFLALVGFILLAFPNLILNWKKIINENK